MKVLKNIKQLPTCGVKGCSNDGLVYMAGDFICGECVIRFENMKNKKIMDELARVREQEKGEFRW